ncbi:MAG: hypothetical protein ACYDAD_00590 [Acidimicrobiales bacterium]
MAGSGGPQGCSGVAVLRAEALERLGRKPDALAVARAAAAGGHCRVAEIVVEELERS